MLYTIFSWKLWKATVTNTELTRYAGFANLMMEVTKSSEELKLRGEPEARLMEEIVNIMWEFGYDSFLEDIKIDKRQSSYFERIEALVKQFNYDPNNIPWLKIILNKIKESEG